ncbi:MAG: hypothetical protein LBK22_08810, partial [Tannerella sp.]|nr:hypothetical protein [Tannerella sp.]
SEQLDCELVEDDTIRMAAEICEIGAFTRAELDAYDAVLDHIRLELGYAKDAESHEKLRKALEDRDKVIEDRDKVIEDNRKALEDKDRVIEELKKQLTERNEV